MSNRESLEADKSPGTTPSSDERKDGANKLRPAPKLTGMGLTFALLLVCILPLCGLTIYAMVVDLPKDRLLPVSVTLDKRPVPVPGGGVALITDVIVITNLSDHEIPKITIDLNGQYFLHRDKPLAIGEELVLPQAIFSTKSNQRWVPGKYPITKVNVTGQLPSKSRGILELEFPG